MENHHTRDLGEALSAWKTPLFRTPWLETDTEHRPWKAGKGSGGGGGPNILSWGWTAHGGLQKQLHDNPNHRKVMVHVLQHLHEASFLGGKNGHIGITADCKEQT